MDYRAEQFVTLHARTSQSSTDNDVAHVRSDDGSPHVQFDDSAFNVDESTALEVRFVTSFNNAPHDI